MSVPICLSFTKVIYANSAFKPPCIKLNIGKITT